MFIVFEGIDGSGKSVQALKLFSYLKNKKKKVFLTSEPTKNLVLSKIIKDILKKKIKVNSLTFQFLFCADRIEHLEKEIKPKLEKGYIVICDRYFYSTLAYGALNFNYQKIKNLANFFLRPDIVFYLNVRPEIAFQRILKNRTDLEYFEKLEKIKNVWLNYKRIVKDFKEIKVIDGEEDVENVFLKIVSYLNEKKIRF